MLDNWCPQRKYITRVLGILEGNDEKYATYHQATAQWVRRANIGVAAHTIRAQVWKLAEQVREHVKQIRVSPAARWGEDADFQTDELWR